MKIIFEIANKDIKIINRNYVTHFKEKLLV